MSVYEKCLFYLSSLILLEEKDQDVETMKSRLTTSIQLREDIAKELGWDVERLIEITDNLDLEHDYRFNIKTAAMEFEKLLTSSDVESKPGKQFVINEDQIKLVKQLEIDWSDAGFGAPEVDSKRPFGNSDVYRDMVKILGWEAKITIDWVLNVDFDLDEDELPREIEDVLDKLYRTLDKVLEICLRTGTFEPGVYRCGEYNSNWVKVS